MALSTSRTLITKTGISTAQVFDMGGISISGGDFNLGNAIKLGNSSGIITSTSFSGSGANLTSIPAGQLTGTVADARISTLTSSKLSGALPAISGASLTGVTASGLSTTASINTSGIITATSFSGSGANLTSLPAQATIANNSDNRVITGGSGVNLNGEANLTFNGGATGDAQLTVHAEQNDSGADSELILETSNDFTTSVVMFKDSTAEAGSIAYNHGDNYIKLSTNGTNGGTERLRINSSGTTFSFSPDSTTPNIKWRSNDTNWFGSLNQSVGGSTISTFLSTGGDWSASGTTYSATKAIASFETRAIVIHPQFNSGTGKVSFLQKAAGSSTTDGTVTEILKIDNDGIKFGSDTAAANALDDYEEGTFTLTLANVNAPSYEAQGGTYVKIGKLVFIHGTIGVASGLDQSDGSGFAPSGLPFVATGEIAVSLGRYLTLLGGKATSFRNTRNTGTGFILQQGSDSNITYNQLNSSGYFQFAATYITT